MSSYDESHLQWDSTHNHSDQRERSPAKQKKQLVAIHHNVLIDMQESQFYFSHDDFWRDLCDTLEPLRAQVGSYANSVKKRHAKIFSPIGAVNTVLHLLCIFIKSLWMKINPFIVPLSLKWARKTNPFSQTIGLK